MYVVAAGSVAVELVDDISRYLPEDSLLYCYEVLSVCIVPPDILVTTSRFFIVFFSKDILSKGCLMKFLILNNFIFVCIATVCKIFTKICNH
jgi:hypothetical protein